MDCEVWVMVDSNGDYAVGTSSESVGERYTEDIGEAASCCEGYRLVKVTVHVPLPVVAEVQATAPALPAVGVAAVV